MTYTFYLLDADGSIPAFEFAECDSEAAAREHGLALLRERARSAIIEVWDGQQRLFEIGRHHSIRPKPLERYTTSRRHAVRKAAWPDTWARHADRS